MKREIPFEVAITAQNYGGSENERGELVFETVGQTVEMLGKLGVKIEVPEQYQERHAKLRMGDEGRIVLDIKKGKEESPLQGWHRKGSRLVRMFKERFPGVEDDPTHDAKKIIRPVWTLGGRFAGWLQWLDGEWVGQPLPNLKLALRNMGYSSNDADNALGDCLNNGRWTIVCEPFQDLELPGRKWNMDAPQFVYEPVKGGHPTWDKIFDHLGGYLDPYVKNLPWCKGFINTGGDYLKAWVGSVFQLPYEPCAMLSFWGPENCGKSTLHEAIKMLITRGVVSAKAAIKEEYNKALDGALFCVVDEHKIATPEVAAKVREYITARTLAIRAMHENVYHIKNSCHFIHCCNRQNDLEIWPGDTRITSIAVRELLEEEEIPKRKLTEQLAEEGPAITYTLFNFKLPPVVDRLRIPAIATESKLAIQSNNAGPHARELLAWAKHQQAFAPLSAMQLAEVLAGKKWKKEKLRDNEVQYLESSNGVKWPGDGRALRSIVNDAETYLHQHGFGVACVEDHHSGLQFIFTKL